MQKAAVYHCPNSAMAYLKDENTIQVRLRLKHKDVLGVELLYTDLDDFTTQDSWQPQVISMTCAYQSVETDYWVCQVSLPNSKNLGYAFHLLGLEGDEYIYDDRKLRVYTADCLKHLAPFKLTKNTPDELLTPPKWVKQTVWYDILVDRFFDGDVKNNPKETLKWASQDANKTSIFGGDLQGVIAKLDYLQELGVNGLYLGSLFKSHLEQKAPLDHYDLDLAFGTKEKLKELVILAHQRGMKIMLDATFSYMSDFSLQWQDVKRYGTKSRFADWFLINEFPLHYTPTNDPNKAKNLSYKAHQNNPHQPSLNTKNKAVQAYLLEVSRYWLENFEIDAWYVKACDELAYDFLQALFKQVKKLKPDFYIVGQTKYNASFALEDKIFDSVSNEALSGILKDYFIEHEITVSELVYALNEHLMKYQDQTNQVMLNILDNEDTARLLTQCKKDEQLMRAILAFMFILPGSPCLYYGTEDLLTGKTPYANQNCMVWSNEKQAQTMKRFLKLLINFRRRYGDLLNEATLEWGQCNSKFDFLSFTRTFNERKILALFNMGYGSVKFVMPKNAKLILSQNLIENEQRIGQNGFVIIEA